MVEQMDLTELVIVTHDKGGGYQEIIHSIAGVDEYVFVERHPLAGGGGTGVHHDLRRWGWIERVLRSNDYRLVAILDAELRE